MSQFTSLSNFICWFKGVKIWWLYDCFQLAQNMQPTNIIYTFGADSENNKRSLHDHTNF